MSILDKHPAPWTRDECGDVVDGNGAFIFRESFASCIEDEALAPLILAAPELLAALKDLADNYYAAGVELGRLDRKRWAGRLLPGLIEAQALIARIEGTT